MTRQIEFIAGPDGVRDVTQMRAVKTWAEDNSVQNIRGGIIKPRSSPYNKDGTPSWVGLGIEKGMVTVAEGLCGFKGRFVVEVWNSDHVRAIDLISKESELKTDKQIGARTGPGNVIQEIGNALNRDSRLVVKNQMEKGETTYINRIRWAESSVGLERVTAVGRGHAPGTAEYRNEPNLDELLSLRRAFPDLNIALDISHTAGISPENVVYFAHAAIDYHNRILHELGVVLLNQIMVEVDPKPSEAQCDQDQLLDFFQGTCLLNWIRKNIKMEI